jgi:hypothetical protein
MNNLKYKSWKTKEDCRDWLLNLGIDDWYNISTEEIKQKGGRGLLARYKGSIIYALSNLLPEYKFSIWKFKYKPKKLWSNLENRRNYIKWLANELGFNCFEDWYKFTQSDFANNHGNGILDLFKGSHINAILENFPEYDWKRWLFDCVPKDYWKNHENRLSYFKWLKKQLGYKNENDWYKITLKMFETHKGSGLLQLVYNKSPILFLKECMPEIDWKEWKLVSAPNGFWHKKENCVKYLNWLRGILGYKTNDDWYKLTCDDLINNYGSALVQKYGSPAVILIKYIDYDWDILKFESRLKNQKTLYDIVKKIYPDEKVEWNYNHKQLRFKESNLPMQLDVFVPNLNLAFEYQGEQHFFPIEHWGGERAFVFGLKRDDEKRVACQENGIKLVEIDYNWDRTEEFVRNKLKV